VRRRDNPRVQLNGARLGVVAPKQRDVDEIVPSLLSSPGSRKAARRPLRATDGASRGLGYTSMTMWFFVEEPWQYRILDSLPGGVDHAQLAQMRKLTPSERIDAVTDAMEIGEEFRIAVARREPRR
jgi:hypothetical protein